MFLCKCRDGHGLVGLVALEQRTQATHTVMITCIDHLMLLTVNAETAGTYQHFVVRHGVGAQAVAVEGDAVRGGAGVHGVDLPREQAIVNPP